MFSYIDWTFIAIIFAWTGFVRTGLGFGGAALGLPLLLLVGNSPVFWLPIIGLHLLFFTSITLKGALKKVDWRYLLMSLLWILPPALIGIFGLINLPDNVLNLIVYGIVLAYAFIWLIGWELHSNNIWFDKLLLIIGGYIAGLSLTGAPIIVAVYLRYVSKEYLRNTLFILWFILVSMKMSAFITFGVDINWQISLILIPIAYIGHHLGIKAHDTILQNQTIFKRWIGVGLIVVSLIGIIQIIT